MKSCPVCQLMFIDAQDACPLDDTDLVKVRERGPERLGQSLGQYKLICQVGEGPMGPVYLGAHPRLERYVAIKTLRQDLEYPAAIARFFETARTNGRLRHPNIIESVDLIEEGNDGVFGVFELLRGHPLTRRIAAGPLPVERVIDIATQIADALGAIHSAGALHRDLAPRNVIVLAREGRAVIKLTDFGIDQGAAYSMTAYMAPEQAAGAPIDGRTDLYALGALMFEMVTGRHPYPSASDQEYVARHAADPIPSPTQFAPECPPLLERAIMRCLAKHPDQRPASAAQLLADLRGEVLAVAPTAATPPVRPGKGRAGTLLGVGLVVAAGVAAAFVLPRYLSSNTPADAAPAPVAATASPHGPEDRPTTPTSEPTTPTGEPATPPGAPAAPPVATGPSAPEMIQIDIGSRPAGAQVFRTGENALLGVTPFTASLLKSDRRAELRFELAGYQTHEVEISFDESNEITVALERARSRPKKPTKPTIPGKPDTSNPQLPREGTIDPFARR